MAAELQPLLLMLRRGAPQQLPAWARSWTSVHFCRRPETVLRQTATMPQAMAVASRQQAARRSVHHWQVLRAAVGVEEGVGVGVGVGVVNQAVAVPPAPQAAQLVRQVSLSCGHLTASELNMELPAEPDNPHWLSSTAASGGMGVGPAPGYSRAASGRDTAAAAGGSAAAAGIGMGVGSTSSISNYDSDSDSDTAEGAGLSLRESGLSRI
jgi:hypothetical protein